MTTKTYSVQVTITAEIQVEAEDEREAREAAVDEAHATGLMIADVDVDFVEEAE